MGNAPRIHVERVEAVARRHEEAVALRSPEADVGAAFREVDVPERLPGGREHANPVELRRSHAPAAPEIAVDVAAKAVRRAGAGVDDDPRGAQPRAIHYVERVDEAG